MVFIRFQYHLQKHFVVLAVVRLAVAIMIMQAPIATYRFVFILMDLQDLSVGLQQASNKQWGFSNSETTVNFPITFGSVFIILGTKRAIQYEYAVAATDITTTKFFLSTRNGSGSSRVIACNWFALGNQTQWGKISNNRADFPIAFTNFCSAATLFSRGSGSGTWYGDHTSINLSGISCITPDYVLNGTYLAIGL